MVDNRATNAVFLCPLTYVKKKINVQSFDSREMLTEHHESVNFLRYLRDKDGMKIDQTPHHYKGYERQITVV